MERKTGFVLVCMLFSCVPQGGEFVHIPEPAEYMRGYLPIQVSFEDDNRMVVLLVNRRLNHTKVMSFIIPTGQRAWEYTIEDLNVRAMAPDPQGGVWLFHERFKRRGRAKVKDFWLVKLRDGKEVTSLDIQDTMYTDWFSFAVTEEGFVGKPIHPPLHFGQVDRNGKLFRYAPKFRSMREYYEAYRNYINKVNFKKFVAYNRGKLYVLSEALDTLSIYDVVSETLVVSYPLDKPQIIPRGPGRAVVHNRVVDIGLKGDTLWVLTLRDIRFYYGGKLVYRYDFGDKRFLTGTIKNDTFYWITYDKSIRFAPIKAYPLVSE